MPEVMGGVSGDPGLFRRPAAALACWGPLGSVWVGGMLCPAA